MTLHWIKVWTRPPSLMRPPSRVADCCRDLGCAVRLCDLRAPIRDLGGERLRLGIAELGCGEKVVQMVRADDDLERAVAGESILVLERGDRGSEALGAEREQALLRGCANPPVGVCEQRHHVTRELIEPRLADPASRVSPHVEHAVVEHSTQDRLRHFAVDLPEGFRSSRPDAWIEIARAKRHRGGDGSVTRLAAEQSHCPEPKTCLGMLSELQQIATDATGSRLELGGGTGARMASLDEHVEEQDVRGPR